MTGKKQTLRRRSRADDDAEKKKKRSRARARARARARLRKYWSSVHRHNKEAKCIIRATAKYRSRPSPPYPANMCCGKIIQGNDGSNYISEPGASGICAWKRV